MGNGACTQKSTSGYSRSDPFVLQVKDGTIRDGFRCDFNEIDPYDAVQSMGLHGVLHGIKNVHCGAL